ncbi:MAG: GNAT family N-acetyltransferase [Armatimonadota bacterium]|nr:GNAT family N-acetyltransferase [Armatimonadota bacterium]
MVDETGPRAIRDEEYEACLAMLDRAFTFTLDGYFVHYVRGDPWFKNDYCRVYLDNGRIVSALNICRREVRVGSVTLTMGGIGNVGTDPEYRGKGYSSQVLRDAALVMRDDGMDFSILYTGINGFYERLGWRTLPVPYLWGKLRAAESSGGPYTIRHYDVGKDAAALLRIYDQFNAGLLMSAVRTEHYWRKFCLHEYHPAWTILLAENDSQPVAYTMTRVAENMLVFDELGYLSGHEQGLGVLMRKAAEDALDKSASEVRVEPATDETVTALASEIARGFEFRHTNYGMVLFFDLNRTFSRLLPELDKRVQATGLAGSVTIDTEVGSIGLRSDGAGIAIVATSDTDSRAKLTQPDLARLIFGMGPVQDVKSEVAEPARQFLSTLFPPRPFVYWHADMF